MPAFSKEIIQEILTAPMADVLACVELEIEVTEINNNKRPEGSNVTLYFHLAAVRDEKRTPITSYGPYTIFEKGKLTVADLSQFVKFSIG